MNERELTIERFAAGGRGLAHADGKVIFVAGALPGERVVARIERSKARYEEAVTVRRLTSPFTAAPCPHAEACGGCDWMRLPYAAQLEAKADLVRTDFARAGLLDDTAWQAPVPSPAETGYRCRITLKLKGHRAGYYAPGSHTFVPVDDCLVAVPAIRSGLSKLPSIAAGLMSAGFTEIELRAAAHEASAVGVLHGHGRAVPKPDFLRGLAGPGFALGDCTLRYQVGGCALEAGPTAFVQVNLALNERLVSAALTALTGEPAVVDAFCGIGNFGVPLAKAGARVLGFEGQSQAIDEARANTARNSVTATWQVAPEERMAQAWLRAGFPPDAALLLDPPRAGAAVLCAAVAGGGVRPRKIAYVSCDPGTLLRDARTLAAARYRLTSLQCFDLFPQTHHVESLALFELGPLPL